LATIKGMGHTVGQASTAGLRNLRVVYLLHQANFRQSLADKALNMTGKGKRPHKRQEMLRS